ncbi:amino acid adenylation domain-containing protein, partial [Candidatus Dependentiae bacterium]|nr:amino acid adenylation domain-containing protein [Candidatus Dependentiae bacterium]
MNIISCLYELKQKGVNIFLKENDIKIIDSKNILTAEMLKTLRENKVEIKKILSEIQKKSDEIEYESISLCENKEYYELSNAQRRFWILSQFEGQNIAYNIPALIEINGNFYADYMRNAVYELIDRHEILRTVFVTINGEPKQKIVDKEKLKFENYFEYEDISKTDNSESLILNYQFSIINSQFNLETGPLMKIKILKTAADKYLLLFNMHHIISDGWSMNVMMKEIMELYESRIENREPILAAMKLQYKDYAAWQNELLRTEKIGKVREYWLNKFSGDIPSLQIPADYNRPEVKTYNGKTLSFSINNEITAGIKNICKDKGTSLFITLTAAVKVLLYRYTNQNDIITGTPLAGRIHPLFENQIGLYLNTVALRDYIDSEMTFEQFLFSVKNTAIEAYDNEIYPFDRLVDDLKLARDTSRSPLFDVLIVLQNNESVEFNICGTILKTKELESNSSKFDITFIFSETKDEKIQCFIEYNTDIFLETRINKMFGHFIALLESLIKNIEMKIGQINIIPLAEIEIIKKFNNRIADYPFDKTIVDLFEEQAAKRPDAVALVFKNIKLTYAELNEKSNCIANYLIDIIKVEEEEIIALEIERSENIIIAILGIIKAGCAYLPLEISYPDERKSFMIRDSNCRIILTCDSSISFENEKYGIKSLNIAVLSYDKKTNPDIRIKPESLLYIIYTSGTTGVPKGAMIEHRNVVSLMFPHNFQFVFSDKDVWTLFHSYCFDFSVWEMYGALLYGGKLIIVSADEAKDTYSFYNILLDNKVTVLNQTPGAFNNLMEVALHRKKSELAIRYVIFGGEALKPALLGKFHAMYPEVELINMYGITETTVHVTFKKITVEEIENGKSNIGKPIPSLNIFLFDRNLNVVPIGIPGEIFVGGYGVCRGYLKRPELNYERFILFDVFDKKMKLYKSGDAGVYLENGEIVYLGRIDQQVKIRGYRIETGEIENRISEYSGVKEIVVIVTENNELAAYYTSDARIDINELRKFISEKLPSYMIPSFMIQIEKMPLNRNGKIDKKNLPKPTENLQLLKSEYTAPTNENEKFIISIFEDILKIKNIGINDNFFEMGGQSIKAIQAVSGIRKRLKTEIGIKEIFQ